MNLKKIFSYVLLFVPIGTINAQSDQTYIYKVEKAGQLQAEMTRSEAHSIRNLTLSGNLNARDFQLMRDSMDCLAILDLKDVSIKGMTGRGGTSPGGFNLYTPRTIPEYAFCKKRRYQRRSPARQALPARSLATGKSDYHRPVCFLRLPESETPGMHPERSAQSLPRCPE